MIRESCPQCGRNATLMIEDIWYCEPCDKTWSPNKAPMCVVTDDVEDMPVDHYAIHGGEA